MRIPLGHHVLTSYSMKENWCRSTCLVIACASSQEALQYATKQLQFALYEKPALKWIIPEPPIVALKLPLFGEGHFVQIPYRLKWMKTLAWACGLKFRTLRQEIYHRHVSFLHNRTIRSLAFQTMSLHIARYYIFYLVHQQDRCL